MKPRVQITALILSLLASVAFVPLTLAETVQPCKQPASLTQSSPSTTFANRTTLIHEQSTKLGKTDETVRSDLALAVPVARSGGVTFCMPLIVPSLSEPNVRGDVAFTLQAKIFRGTF